VCGQLLLRLSYRLGRPGLRARHDVFDILRAYPWPGNIRELRNVLERAAVLTDGNEISVGHLPRELCSPAPCPLFVEGVGGELNDAVEQYKIRLIVDALRRNGWRKKRAAAELGLSPRALSHYIQRHELEAQRGDSAADDVQGDAPAPMGLDSGT
jgi:DNA-binding NtrC family response regulator